MESTPVESEAAGQTAFSSEPAAVVEPPVVEAQPETEQAEAAQTESAPTEIAPSGDVYGEPVHAEAVSAEESEAEAGERGPVSHSWRDRIAKIFSAGDEEAVVADAAAGDPGRRESSRICRRRATGQSRKFA